MNIPILGITDNNFILLHYYYVIIGIFLLIIMLYHYQRGDILYISILSYIYTLSLVYLNYSNMKFQKTNNGI